MTYNSLQGTYFHNYDWVCQLTTTTSLLRIYKGDQVTKPILVVKMPCKLFPYVIQVVKNISKFLVAHAYVPIYNAASDHDWPPLFIPRVFLFSNN